MKKCFKCNKTKTLNDYYKHPQMGDGHLNKCKACTRQDTNNNRIKNLDYYLEYDRNRGSLPHRIKLAEKYRKTEAYKASQKKAKLKWNKTNKEKRYAHSFLWHRIREGKIKQQPCEICKIPKGHAHHDDYSKPLEVKWLCHKHHMQRHKELNEIKRLGEIK